MREVIVEGKNVRVVENPETIALLEALVENGVAFNLTEGVGYRAQKSYKLPMLGTLYVIDRKQDETIVSLLFFVEDTSRCGVEKIEPRVFNLGNVHENPELIKE